MSYCFPRDNRLLSAADFSHVFEKPIKSSDVYFTLLAQPRVGQQVSSRLGLAIAKKQLKHAVDRNRIKRLIREFFRKQILSDVTMDYVVLARHKALKRSNQELRTSLERLFEDINKKT